MKEEKLTELLEKYYNGDSSPEEEQLLKEYFRGTDILPGYEAEKGIFRFYSEKESVSEPSDDFESRLIDSIDNISKKQNSGILFRRKIRLVIYSAAAVVLLMTGTYFFFIYEAGPKDTYTDPRIAYEETKRLLYDISAKLNKGTAALQKVSLTAQAGFTSLENSAGIISHQVGIVENIGKHIIKENNKKNK